jgi:putative membrane protein
MEWVMAYLHYVSIMTIAGALVGELVLCRPGLGAEHARRLPVVDAIFFGAAMAALATGLLRLLFYAKGWMFYLPNPFFLAKMALYVAIALVSIRPTAAFLRWRRAAMEGGTMPGAAEVLGVRKLVHIELGLLALMPLMAVLMARGIGR